MKNSEIKKQNQITCDSVTQNNEQKFSDLIKQVQTNLYTQLLHYHFIDIQPTSSPIVNISNIDYTYRIKNYKTHVYTKRWQKTMSMTLEENVQYYGYSYLKMVAATVSQSLVNEHHTELCNFIYNHSCDANTFRLDVSDKPSVNLNKLYNASYIVAQQTNRNPGNKWILPISVYMNILPRLHDTQFIPHNSDSPASDLSFAGTLNDNIEIFVSLKNTVALIIYKSECKMDNGYVYSPYQFRYDIDQKSNTVSFNTLQALFTMNNNYCMNIQVR